MNDNYQDFLQSKRLSAQPIGLDVPKEALHPKLFDFQRDIVHWALSKGRAAIFADVGLGKTGMGLAWSSHITDLPVLCIVPFPAVARQIEREAREVWGMENVHYVRNSEHVEKGHIYITNVDAMITGKGKVQHFNPDKFGAIWLDESSILKNLTGVQKKMLVEFASGIQYRLATTATPAPNDIIEIANHSEFLGIMNGSVLMDRFKMTSMFFTYNSNGKGAGKGGTKSKGAEWVIKKHGQEAFYRWLASWAVAMKKPSDLGYSNEGYELPPIEYHVIEVGSEYTPEGMLPGFAPQVISATEISRVRRATLPDKVTAAVELVNADDSQWIVWGKLNDETSELEKVLQGSVDVHGSLDPEVKGDYMEQFISGEKRVLISKSSIAGMGMNFQHCHNMLFFGLDFSWESFYQSIGRIYRFGQTEPVHVWILISKQENNIYKIIQQKGKEATKMTLELIEAAKDYTIEELKNLYTNEWKYATDTTETDNWKLMLGDSALRLQEIPDESVDISIYSPPFESLFVYSASEHDLGNCASHDEFFEHYGYIIRENYRVMKQGRLTCVHIQDTRAFKNLDGYIGRKDLSGDVITAYQEAGFVFWQRITINKNPQIQAIRLKAQDLLFATLKKDATSLAGGMADYLLIFKKPGQNEVPVLPMDNGEMTENDWIEWAHPVWNDIKETNVLNVKMARNADDTKHVAPLQLDVIERCLKLWSNPNELMLTCFAGIGSEMYEAVRWNRRAIGCELKPEYYRSAIHNLHNAERVKSQRTLFDYAAELNA